MTITLQQRIGFYVLGVALVTIFVFAPFVYFRIKKLPIVIEDEDQPQSQSEEGYTDLVLINFKDYKQPGPENSTKRGEQSIDQEQCYHQFQQSESGVDFVKKQLYVFEGQEVVLYSAERIDNLNFKCRKIIYMEDEEEVREVMKHADQFKAVCYTTPLRGELTVRRISSEQQIKQLVQQYFQE